jgi:hypothetical protein
VDDNKPISPTITILKKALIQLPLYMLIYETKADC